MVELAWVEDERLSFLFDLVGNELENRLDTAQGVVVFFLSNWHQPCVEKSA